MTAQSVLTPYSMFTDRSGAPLTGGKIYIGAAGANPITNPINVFFDAALTVPAAQPIRTQGGFPVNGSSPVRLFVDADQYSMVVQNSAGSTLYSSLVSELLSVQQIIRFDATDAEIAAGVTIVDATRQPGDFVRYGFSTSALPAVNTTAANAAMAANSFAFCNDPGTYVVDATLQMQSGQTVRLAQGVTIQAATTMASTNLFEISDVENVHLYGGVFDGNKAGNPDGILFGVRVLNAHHVRLYGVTAQNFPSDNTTLGAGGDGFYVGGISGGSPGSSDVELHGCSGLDNVRQGLSIVRVDGCAVIGGKYSGTTGNNPGAGIDVEANPGLGEAKNVRIVGAEITDNFFGVVVTTEGNNVTITGCTIAGNRGPAIVANAGSNLVVTGNIIESGITGAANPVIDVITIDRFVLTGNTIKGNRSADERAGVRVLFGENISITNNLISETAQQGIQLGSSSQSVDIPNVLVQGNTLLDCVVSGTAAPLSVSGNSGGGFYPTQVTVINNQIIDTRTGGAEADVAISFASFPSAVLAGLRVSDNHVFGPALDFSAAFDPPLMGRINFSPGALADGAGATSGDISVPGAAIGDSVMVFPPADIQGALLTGYVTATDTCRIRIQNETGGALASAPNGSYKVRVVKALKL